MSRFDDFVERLEAALEDEEGREDFVEYLRGMTPEERAELLAEAERRDPEGAAELARGCSTALRRAVRARRAAGRRRSRRVRREACASLNYELDAKVFHVDLSCFVGEVDGSGFAPVVYEMPEMQFRRIVLGLGRDPLEGGWQLKKL